MRDHAQLNLIVLGEARGSRYQEHEGEEPAHRGYCTGTLRAKL
jgi:hypothetical protein